MAQRLAEGMTGKPVLFPAPLARFDAARPSSGRGVEAVVPTQKGRGRGVVSDRDLHTGGLPEGLDVLCATTEFWQNLTGRCVQLLGVVTVGVVLGDGRADLRVAASSGDAVRILTSFEVQNQGGPCLHCYRTGESVVNEPLDGEKGRWPDFSRAAREIGFRSVHALPIRLRGDVVGVLTVFSAKGTSLGRGEAAIAQTMADAASIALLQTQALEAARVLADQLLGALKSRVIIEQAKGILAERTNVDVDVAFHQLRTYARSHNERLSEVARGVVEATLPADAFTAALKGPERCGGYRGGDIQVSIG